MKQQYRPPQKICVLGLGYIGLPTASLLANCGYDVHGVDLHSSIVEKLNRGEIHIVEPELENSLLKAIKNGNFHASLEPCEADIFIICVPTPFSSNADKIPEPDLSFVLEAARGIASFLKEGNSVILESTSPVGSTEKLIDEIGNTGASLQGIHFAYCPERVLPGKILRELVGNDRIVGGIDPESTEIISAFYESFIHGEVLKTDARTAEMCKLVENASRDVQIAFANELSMICDDVNVDVRELIRLANHHPRVNILNPGCGVGGHCIAVDPWFLVNQSPDNAQLIRCAREVNERKPEWVLAKIVESAGEWEKDHGKIPRITCMGLSFKPDVDDLRESPALAVAERLDSQMPNVHCCEPHLDHHKSLTLIDRSEINTLSDILVFLVAHSSFRSLAVDERIVVLDFCGLLNN